MNAFLSRPAVALGDHKVTTEEIIEDIRLRHPDHPRLSTVLRVIGNCGVDTRYMAQPLTSPTVSGEAGVEERVRSAFDDALRMAVRASVEALDNAGLDPGRIDCIVTSHTTVLAVPGLDAHLVNELGLPATVRRIPLTTLACAGGAHALVRAAEFVAAHPGSRVLVVVAEIVSSTYNHNATSLPEMLYKALFGDSAAAVVVSGDPLRDGLCITDTWEYLLPASTDRYQGRIDAHGLHFESARAAMATAGEVIPLMRDWYESTSQTAGRGGPVAAAEVAVVHPGGPRIISDSVEGLGLEPEAAVHSWNSLRENGNLGGVAVLEILARTYESRPRPGAPAILLAFGPGFSASACRGYWHA